jgi:glycosyltransferase involved in cell wall biosynthesis
MKEKTVSVLIPALNEEKNILNLLEDICAAQMFPGFTLEKILVISDGSTDRTNEIVETYAQTHKNVELVINEKRIGKIFSVGKGYRLIDSEYLVMFDADVQIEKETLYFLCQVVTEHPVDLVAGNPVPFHPKSFWNVAEQASMFSWHLVQAIKNSQPDSIYSAHGRILMLSKALFKRINIHELSTPGDDQFIYLQSVGSFFYTPKAIVKYRLPGSIGDYIKQNVRFRRAQEMRTRTGLDTKGLFKVKKQLEIIIKAVISHPIRFFFWIILYATGSLKYHYSKKLGKSGDNWGVANSTK